MKLKLRTVFLAVSAAAALTACSQHNVNQPDRQLQSKAVPPQQVTHPHDAGVIPSENGNKVRTTNEHGGTSYGLGSSVYSLIGSSGLHSSGFSSHLESRLSGAGIHGVSVFVFDDTVILATDQRQATASQYDPLQSKLLSNTGGLSAHGPEPSSGVGTMGTGKMKDDNLDMAASRINEIMGAKVKVLTVTGAKAVDAITTLRQHATEQTLSPKQLADDFRTLLELTMSTKK